MPRLQKCANKKFANTDAYGGRHYLEPDFAVSYMEHTMELLF